MRSKIMFSFLMAAVCANADSETLSQALGHLIGKNLQSLDIPLDVDAIAKGLQDEAAGISSPMTEEACVKALMKLQEEKSLKEAAAFLEENKKRDGVTAMEGGKLQIEILKKGNGEEVQPYNSPLIRLNSRDEILALDEAIAGVKLGIVGMKEGEVRKLYIHPDLADQNSLLILEVEVIKADASPEAHAASHSDSSPVLLDTEIR